MSLLSTPEPQSIIVSGEVADGASVDSVAGSPTVTGFSAANVLDPQPAVRWRVDVSDGTGFAIILDLQTTISPISRLLTPEYNYFGAYFHNSRPTLSPPENTWRIRIADTVADTTANPNFDSGLLPLWSNISGIEQGTFKDPLSYFPPGATSHFLPPGELFGGGSGSAAEGDRFVRISFDTPINQVDPSFFEIGRIVIGKATSVRIPIPGNKPVPFGTPAKQIITWDVVMTREQYEEFIYPLPRSRGSSPRVLRSWGFDVFPLDGAGTLVAVNDVLAPDPWTRHQGTVYGYLEDFSLVSVRSEDNHRVQLTVRGLG